MSPRDINFSHLKEFFSKLSLENPNIKNNSEKKMYDISLEYLNLFYRNIDKVINKYFLLLNLIIVSINYPQNTYK